MAMVNPKIKNLERERRRKPNVSKRIGMIALFALVLVLTVATGVFAAQNSAPDNVQGTSDFAGPNTFNANGTTGYPNEVYLPNESDPASYRVHSNYNSTTDACASCHATHTGTGEALLQWGTVYDTCMACHDGTVTTTYDVKHGVVGSTTARASAGVFGDGSGSSASNHNVKGALSVYAAPGGPGTAGVDPTPVLNSKGSQVNWDVEFGCQSCHSPHGQGGNARLLNPDVNGYAWANKQTARALSKVDATTYTSDFNGDGVADTWVQGYPFSSKVYIGGVQDTTVTINNEAGYTKVIFAAEPQAAVTADFYPALVVKMNVENYLAANEKVTQVAGLNAFCGACHADYNTESHKVNGQSTGSGSDLTGTYTEAYRHQVGRNLAFLEDAVKPKNMKLESGVLTCETCHVAHGTDSQYWTDTLKAANGGSLPATIAEGDLKELAGSSALKRLPNMGTCETCHAKGMGNQGYNPTVAGTSDQLSGSPGGSYVGQAACANCHADNYKHFQETWHPSKTRPGVSAKVVELAQNLTAAEQTEINDALNNVTGSVGGIDLKQEILNTQTELDAHVSTDANGTKSYAGIDPAKITVWSTGKDESYIFLRGSKLYGAAVGTTAGDSWHFAAKVIPEAPDGELALEGRSHIAANYLAGDAQYGCFGGCHVTGYDSTIPGYTGKSADFTKLWLNKVAAGQKPAFEVGVTCEACHGQGGNHVKAPSAKNIVNPSTFETKVQTVGPGSDGHGTTYSSTKTLLNTTANAKSCASCHTGGHHQGDFYSAATWAWGGTPAPTNGPSTHFTSGAASCNTCHNVHKKSTQKTLLKKDTYQQTCGGCHSTITDFNTNINQYLTSFTEAGYPDPNTSSMPYVTYSTHTFKYDIPNFP